MDSSTTNGDAREDPLLLRAAPWAVLVLLVAFIGVNLPAHTKYEWLRPMLLGAVLVVTAIWFIACFTGDAEPKMRHAFVFAYAFTFGAFALLVTPFVGSNDLRAQGSPAERPPEGVLQLVRGCMVNRASGGQAEVSDVTRCPGGPSWAAADAANEGHAEMDLTLGDKPPLPIELGLA